MNSHVYIQITFSTACFVTDLTLKGFFSSMYYAVFSQVTFSDKLFTTFGALEWFFSCVDPGVHGQ